jgi:drug/metabolite transporter (DMT)-like permease
MMHKNKSFQNLLELNLAILFISTSGVLGRYIDLPVPVTICSRAIIGGFFIFLFCKWRRFDFKVQKQDRSTLFVSGLLLGLHWLTYFYSLKLSNVAIGMISLFTFPIITTFLEPMILRTKFERIHLVLGIFVLLGVYFLIPDLNFDHDYSKAIALGVLSAFFYSLRNIITKAKIKDYNGSVLMLYQLVVITVMLSPFYFLENLDNFTIQLPGVIILSLLTTAIGHTWFLYSFKKFSVTSASIISSLQPVYGILMGMVFLHEYPEPRTIIGGTFIIVTVIVESIYTYRKSMQMIDPRK